MLCTCLLLFLVQNPSQPLPELKPFVAELRKTLHTDTLLLSQYTYTEKQTSIQLDSKDRPKKTEVNVFEVFPRSPERVGYRRQIVKNGTPLSAAELKKADQELQKNIVAAQRRFNQRTPGEREKARAERLRKEEQILDESALDGERLVGGRGNLACFSHEAYTGFVMWGFWEGAHWKPETALWRKDWTEKPAAKIWKVLPSS